MTDALATRRLCVAPMMDWTDRHCRHFHRLLAPNAWLYTEMITTGALRHGDVPRHLRFHPAEHPVALQLGGSEPDELAYSARLAEQWGYDEVNLNCGCPSERVQNGAFGACLMHEPQLVRDCVKAMCDASSLPITVKHRIGLGKNESYDFVRDFVGTVAAGGARTFIVHARNAWLEGLSPKENREIPPLRYEVAWQLKRDFPQLEIIVNGGITHTAQIVEQLTHVDGVMIGREAYHNPWQLTEWERALFNPDWAPQPREVLAQLLQYWEAENAQFGTHLRAITRHMLSMANGLPGARRFRRSLSDPEILKRNDGAILFEAWQEVETAMAEAAENKHEAAPQTASL